MAYLAEETLKLVPPSATDIAHGNGQRFTRCRYLLGTVPDCTLRLRRLAGRSVAEARDRRIPASTLRPGS